MCMVKNTDTGRHRNMDKHTARRTDRMTDGCSKKKQLGRDNTHTYCPINPTRAQIISPNTWHARYGG